MALKQELMYWKNVAMEFAINNKLDASQKRILENIPSRNASQDTKTRWINQVKANFSSKAIKLKAEKKQLRNKLDYQKRKLLKEQRRKEARNRLMNLPKEASDINKNFTQKLSFKEIWNEGIRIYDQSNKTWKRLKGKKAVEYKIKSLIKQNNPEYKKQIFMKEYLKQMSLKFGKNSNVRKKAFLVLEKLEPRQITYLLNSGLLPDINYYYVADKGDRANVEAKLDFIAKGEWKKDFEANEKNVNAEMKLIEEEEKLKQPKYRESKKLKRNR